MDMKGNGIDLWYSPHQKQVPQYEVLREGYRPIKAQICGEFFYTTPYAKRQNLLLVQAFFIKNPKIDINDEPLVSEFNELVSLWKEETSICATAMEMIIHPAYQQIIGMGRKAIPLILKELMRAQDHWFWALKMISREDPVPESARGNINEISKAWIDWGYRKGYLK